MWPEKNGKYWRIREETDDGKKVTLESGFTTKTAAKNRITELTADQIRGEYVDPRHGTILLADWAEAWWKTHEPTLKPSAQNSEGRRLRNHIISLLGACPIGEIDRGVIKLWVAELAKPEDEERKPLAAKSIRNAHGLLYSVMQAAVDEKKIRTNPCHRTGLPAADDKEMRFLDETEVGRLLAVVPQHWRTFVLLLAATGMRFGEAAALRVGKINVAARTVRIERTLHELPDLVETIPKSKYSRRTVTVPDKVIEALGSHLEKRDRQAYVFLPPRGPAIRYSHFWRMWNRELKGTEFEGLRIHDLRHTHAAALISDGRPLTAIQRRLGHSSIQITSDTYGHLLPEVDREIVGAVERFLACVDFGSLVGGTLGGSNPQQPDSTLRSTDEHENAPDLVTGRTP